MYLSPTDPRKYIILDIETDSLQATTIHCGVAIGLADKVVTRLRGREEVGAFIRRQARDVVYVGHNFLSFDAPTINRLCGTSIPVSSICDTLVLSYLYDPRMVGGHSLEAYGERLGKPKDLFSDFSRFSEELLERCAQDALINLDVYEKLRAKMLKIGFSEKSCQLEHEIRHVINKQQRNGFYFDVPKAEAFYASLRETERSLRDSIQNLFPPELVMQGQYQRRKKKDGSDFSSYLRHLETYPEIRHKEDGTYATYSYEEFNLGSPKQRIDRLLRLGYKPNSFTPTGQPKVDEDELNSFAKATGRREVNALADWLCVNARANMVNSWLGVVGSDGRIRGRVFSCGAASRRMTHNSPNTANVPSNEAKYGRECRELWTVEGADDVLVGYDAKAAQMRCFAHFLPDPNLGRRYWDTDLCPDPHQENADIIGIGRKPIKNVFYANIFGAYPPKLATTAGRSGTKGELEKYGRWIKDQLFLVTPGLKEMTEAAQSEFRMNAGWMRCIDGGYVRCPSENASLNYWIQPAEAVLMKTAAVMIDKETRRRGIEHKKVCDVHDEGQHETKDKDAEVLGPLCTEAIRHAGEELGFRVPMAGDYKIGRTWSQTH